MKKKISGVDIKRRFTWVQPTPDEMIYGKEIFLARERFNDFAPSIVLYPPKIGNVICVPWECPQSANSSFVYVSGICVSNKLYCVSAAVILLGSDVFDNALNVMPSLF